MSQKKPQTNDISNIADLTKKYKRGELEQLILELRALNKAQDATIQIMHEALVAKDAEIETLKAGPAIEVVGSVERIMPTNEEIIVEMQLEKIREKARLGELTLEEARKFEIFTKYKQNKKDNSIPTTSRKASPEETTKLLSVASQYTTRDLKQDE